MQMLRIRSQFRIQSNEIPKSANCQKQTHTHPGVATLFLTLRIPIRPDLLLYIRAYLIVYLHESDETTQANQIGEPLI